MRNDSYRKPIVKYSRLSIAEDVEMGHAGSPEVPTWL